MNKLTIEDIRNVLNVETEIAFGNDKSRKRKRLVYNAFQGVYRIYLEKNVVQRYGAHEIDKALDFYNAM